MARQNTNSRNTDEMLYKLNPSDENSFSHLKLTPVWKRTFLLIIKGYTDKEIMMECKITRNTLLRHKERMKVSNNCSTIKELTRKHYAKRKS